jgi:hypothetical protein
MANRLHVGGLGGLSFDTADEDHETIAWEAGTVQSAPKLGDRQLAAAAGTAEPSRDDEEDWQRFFL